jgi:aryl-alcohol dehydrogenase-like predicted oxidoreductase
MQYRQLGHSGLIVSRLSFGAMTFGSGNVPAIYKVDQENARAMLHRALDAGVNFFDTADGYAAGQSEQMLGAVLGPGRSEVVISTKVGFRTGPPLIQAGLSRQHLIAGCEASLRRLGTDYIDVYSVHKTDPFTPLEETLETLDALVRQGKVRYLGYSNWPAWMAAKAVQMQKARGWARFVSAQMYYSLVGRDLEHEIVPMIEDAGLGLMVWSPLAGGFLSGKYTPENLKDQDNRLSSFDVLPFDKNWAFHVVDQLRAIAGEHKATPAQVALAWLLAKPHVSTVVIGASNMRQLEDNLGAASLTLTPADLASLDQLTRPTPIYPNWFTGLTLDQQTKQALTAQNAVR